MTPIPVRSVYQPIVDFDTGETVGYEALARGPRGHDCEMPAQLFGRAAAEGWSRELEWGCQAAAIEGALDGGLGRDLTLFVNVEPEYLDRIPPAPLLRTITRAESRLRIMVEISERKVMANPSQLLSLCRHVRQRGWGLALDDIGTNPDSLSLLPLVNPDVIKLDLSIVQNRATRRTARVLNAVLAHAETTGALVLAEGIETEAHLASAKALGAQYGQGWLFGRPGPLPADARLDASAIPIRRAAADPIPVSPFHAVRDRATVRRATKPLLIAMSQDLEQVALSLDERAVVAACFQTAERFTSATRARYRRLGERCAIVSAVGHGLGVTPEETVRGGTLTAGDPLNDEWAVAVLSPHFAGALAAYDLGDSGPDDGRRFDYVLTHDRRLVTEIARSLLDRVQSESRQPVGASATSRS